MDSKEGGPDVDVESVQSVDLGELGRALKGHLNLHRH